MQWVQIGGTSKMPYDARVFTEAFSGAVEAGTKAATQEDVIAQSREKTEQTKLQTQAAQFQMQSLIKQAAENDATKSEVRALSADKTFQALKPWEKAERLSSIMLNKGDVAGADKLLESGMKMEKMEWDRKDQGYRALESGMDRARASIKGASDQEAAQSMLMQALMSYPPQLQPLVQGAINDLKKLGFQEWQKKWGDETGPLGMTQRSIEQRRLAETARHNEKLETIRQNQVDVNDRRVDALITKATTGSEDKNEARIDRQAASAASRISAIERGLERDQSYAKAQTEVEKAQRDLDNAGMFTSEAPLKKALERAQAKLEDIKTRNINTQRTIARSQSPEVQERLREARPDLFEPSVTPPATPVAPVGTSAAPPAPAATPTSTAAADTIPKDRDWRTLQKPEDYAKEIRARTDLDQATKDSIIKRYTDGYQNIKREQEANKKLSDDKPLTREQVKTRWEEVKKRSQEEQIQFINDNKQYFLPPDIPKTAKLAPDGEWYSPDPNRPGKYIKHSVAK
jgi:hypothetical protein